MNNSTIYTVGTALQRAKGLGLAVQVLTEGQWLEGLVADVDGHGLVLSAGPTEHSVVRLEAVTAVRVLGSLPRAGRTHGRADPATDGVDSPVVTAHPVPLEVVGELDAPRGGSAQVACVG